jgi:hypothetical protein
LDKACAILRPVAFQIKTLATTDLPRVYEKPGTFR